MEGGENVLEAIYEEDVDMFDADMLDADTFEEGELKEENLCIEEGEVKEQNDCAEEGEIKDQNQCEGGGKDVKMKNGGSYIKNRRRKAKKKKAKKNNKTGPAPSLLDINRFVVDTSRRLKEKKSYLVWNAVGCLGVAALSDLVKEVEAIQVCGGQMTADGTRPRTGGGILWNILKTREPKAYNEIMAKGKELEKQLYKPNIRQEQKRSESTDCAERNACISSDQIEDNVSGGFQFAPQRPIEPEKSDAHEDRRSVLNGIRVPVAYDDLFGENEKDEPEKSDAHEDRRSVLNRIRVPIAYDDLFGENEKDEGA